MTKDIRLERETNGWSIYIDNVRHVYGESFTVASRIFEALNNPNCEPEPTEIAEIVDSIRLKY